MEECIFCKIVAGKLPSYKVFENDEFYAFLDIFPRTKGHTLLIPKKHYQWVYDVPNFGKYWETALTITKALQKSLQPTFITYVTHGLEIPHAHIHIMPRHAEKEFVPDVKKLSSEELTAIAEKVRKTFD